MGNRANVRVTLPQAPSAHPADEMSELGAEIDINTQNSTTQALNKIEIPK